MKHIAEVRTDGEFITRFILKPALHAFSCGAPENLHAMRATDVSTLMQYLIRRWLSSVGLITLLATTPALMAEIDQSASDEQVKVLNGSSDWKETWAVPKGFSIAIDTEGYQYPTAIAFVPNPGTKPKDPLYFVTELRGKVKVVTNDRTVYTFAKGFLHTEFGNEIPHGQSEFGAAGICLAPAQGYVFVTFTYQDDGNVLRNNVIRFNARPKRFSIKPESQLAFTDVFAPYESGPSHQIGSCKVDNGMLYVGVGDGFRSPLGSQRIDTLLGKIVRLDLNGKPVSENPFYEDDDVHKARNYVWAYGLRNPFSLDIVDGHVLVTENGLNVDRFLEIRQGQNYLWNGKDESIATNAAYVFLDSQGPVQMNHYPATASFFPKRYANQFYVALSSGSSVDRLRYDVKDGRMLATPATFVQHKGGGRTHPVVGVAFGSDGLYFAPLFPVRGSTGAVIKVKYDPKNAHGLTLAQLADPVELAESGKDLMREKGCLGCHRITGVFELGGIQGPVLDQGDGPMVDRILTRISSQEYLQSLQALDARDEAPFNRYKKARDEVANSQGLERLRVWMKYHIIEPRFDTLYSTMPNLGLSGMEAEAITQFLLAHAGGSGFMQKLKELIPELKYRHLAYAFSAGTVVGMALLLLIWIVSHVWFRRQHARRPASY